MPALEVQLYLRGCHSYNLICSLDRSPYLNAICEMPPSRVTDPMQALLGVQGGNQNHNLYFTPCYHRACEQLIRSITQRTFSTCAGSKRSRHSHSKSIQIPLANVLCCSTQGKEVHRTQSLCAHLLHIVHQHCLTGFWDPSRAVSAHLLAHVFIHRHTGTKETTLFFSCSFCGTSQLVAE